MSDFAHLIWSDDWQRESQRGLSNAEARFSTCKAIVVQVRGCKQTEHVKP